MRLHVFPPSPNAIKVLFAARHLGLSPEIQLVDLFAGGNQTAEFATLNPNRKMPVLEDEGFVLWESNAILQYLAAKEPESGLWPADPRDQADVSRWQFWQTAHWGPACGTLVFERVVKRLTRQGEPDAGEIERGEREFHRFAEVLNAHLADRKWVAADRLTVADVSIGAWMPVAGPAAYPLERYPRITGWYAGLQALPAWKESLPPES